MIRTKDDLRRHIAADLAAHGPDRWRPVFRLRRRVVYFQWLLRRSEYWTNCRRDPAGRLWAGLLELRVLFLAERLGLTIPRDVFGPGLSIAHHGSIVVNGLARVGARCRIHQGVTIGADERGAPVIGSDVFIGPNAMIIGSVTVGDNVMVLPGAVVVDDVPDHATVAGVPARVLGVDPERTPWRPS